MIKHKMSIKPRTNLDKNSNQLYIKNNIIVLDPCKKYAKECGVELGEQTVFASAKVKKSRKNVTNQPRLRRYGMEKYLFIDIIKKLIYTYTKKIILTDLKDEYFTFD